MEEIWKDVVGYEGLYKVSNLGKVLKLKNGKLVRLQETQKGYICVSLTKNGKTMYCRLHRIVCKTFIGEIKHGCEVDHINGLRNDNRLENLRIVTHKENCNNPITIQKIKTINKGRKNPNFGKRLSEKTKSKISESLKKSNKHPWRDKHLSETHKRKISNSHKGKSISETVKLKKSKPILQFDLNGNFLSEWISATIIEKQYKFSKSNICNCCRGKLKSAYGYIWKYKI